MITLRATLLLQWVIITSPSLILLAPISPMKRTALLELSMNVSAFFWIRATISPTSFVSSTPLMVAWTPFHRETAVGLDSRSVVFALFRSERNESLSLPL